MKPFKGNTKVYVIAIVSALGLAASPAARAQGCCGGGPAAKEPCSMGDQETSGHAGQAGHAGHDAAASSGGAKKAVFMEPVQSVFDNYITIQSALAQDSLDGVSKTATAVAKAIRGDSMHMLPPKVAEQADALAQAKDLETARTAYKPLSESLIKYAKAQKLPAGAYYEAHCPMAKASWLQTDKTIVNPYMGKAMLHCGQIRSWGENTAAN
jgi:Cu(I)/Ag(I) efflux system membrane fusion protein